MDPFETVACELTVRLAVAYDVLVPVPARFTYRACDPYAVHAAFHPAGQGQAVEWVFGRDLLAEALHGHSGLGDVRMWPSGDPGHEMLHIALGPPAGTALLEVPASEVKTFLRATQFVVAPGDESARLDMDTALAQLLAEN